MTSKSLLTFVFSDRDLRLSFRDRSNSTALELLNSSPDEITYVRGVYFLVSRPRSMESISAVWPPEPRTMRR